MDFQEEVEEFIVLDSGQLEAIPNKKPRLSDVARTQELKLKFSDKERQELQWIEESDQCEGQAVTLGGNEQVANPNIDILSNKVTATDNATHSKTLEEKLLAYLKSDGDGRLILTQFKDQNRLLPLTRSLLTRTIIKKFKDDALKDLQIGEKLVKFKIGTKVFIAISLAIQNLFPGESASTYYSPYKSENGITVQTSGTLWSHYNYMIEKLRSQNLLERSKSSKKNSPPTAPQSDEIQQALNALQFSLDPTTCHNDWKITHKSRQVLLLVDKLSISDYMGRFPCLKVQSAKHLIELDFDLLKPGKSHLLPTRWPTIKTILIEQFQILAADQKKKKKIDVDDLSYIKLLPTLEPDHQDAVVLYLLQLLIGAGQPGRKKKDDPPDCVKRYQPVDIRESFICRVEKTEDVDAEIARLKKKILQRKDTLQPFMLIVGPLFKSEESYVVVDDQKYKVSSCLAALELTFKTFFAFDCEYPRASQRLWQFIQHAAYNIEVAGETVIRSVRELLGLVTHAFRQAPTPRPQESSSSTT